MLVNPSLFSVAGAGTGTKTITVVAAKIGAAGDITTPFTITIKGTYTYLKDVAHGGNLASVNNVVFYNTDHSTVGKFERELHNLTTGEVVYHFKSPVNLSKTVDTVVGYLDWDASASDRSDAANTWDSTFKRVVHGGDGSTPSGVDSSTAASNFAVTNATAAAGDTYGALSFSAASNQYLNDAHAAVTAYPISMTVRAKLANTVFGTGEERVLAAVVKKSGLDEFWFGYIEVSGVVNLRAVAQGTGIGTVRYFGGTATLDTNWHTLSCAIQSDVSTFLSYQDGVSLTGYSVTGTLTPASLSDTYIGGFFYNTSNFYGQFIGLIDEVRISNVARPTQWLIAEHNNLNDPSTFYTLT